MPNIPGSGGDALDPEDDPRFGDDSDSNGPESSKSYSSNRRDEVGEHHPAYPGASFFNGVDTQTILERLLDGDPLGIRERCSEWTLDRFYLVDFERLMMRTMAMVAHSGRSYRGEIPFHAWIYERIDRSAEQLMEEEREADRKGAPLRQPYPAHYEVVASVMGVSPESSRPGCIRFNQLDIAVRRAFFAICIDGLSFNRFIAEGHGPPARVRSQLKQAFEALTIHDDGNGDLFPDISEFGPFQ